MQLTREQNNIIHHKGGHARVSAVAGSGKTTAMVARVHYLLQQGTAPDDILVLMFNKSARDAFADRLDRLLENSDLIPPRVRTFHSLGLRLIQSFTARKILPPHRLLTEEYHQEKLAREAMKHHVREADGDEQWLSREDLDDFLTFIHLVKAHTDTPQQVFSAYGYEEQLSRYVPAFTIFESMRTRAGVRFFDDLIHEPVQAIRQDRELADWVADHVDHIIVDEYQDINEVQQQLLRCIAGRRARVMVVGDVDQCIYEWRGAKPAYIVSRFGHDFPGSTSYSLSFTFRYGHRLALAANHLISNNRFRDRKLCLAWPGNPDTRIHQREEGQPHPVGAIIDRWLQAGRSLHEAAVLVRMYAQSIPVELALLEHGIPYRLVGHDTVFSCPEIRALVGYLHLCRGDLDGAADPEHSRAMLTAMLTNPHLWLKQEGITALADNILRTPHAAATLILEQAKNAKSSYLAGRMADLAAVWQQLMRLPPSTPAAEVLEQVIRETELYDHYRFASRPVSAENKIKTCQAFVRFARRRDQDVNGLLQEIEQLAETATDPAGDVLLLTSVHRAKGLEWPLVILPGLEHGVVPYRQEDEPEGKEGLEDERRIFYVAMTRAREQLWLLHPPDNRLLQRQKTGTSRTPTSTQDGACPASCFLYEANLMFSDRVGERILNPGKSTEPLSAADISIASSYLKAVQADVPLKRSRPSASHPHHAQPGLPMHELDRGLMVRHALFGPGIITAVDRRRGTVAVLFDEHGSKNLVVKYAGLQLQEGGSDDEISRTI